MKILPVTYSQKYIQQNHSYSNNVQTRAILPSFGNAQEKLAKEILKNPEWTKAFADVAGKLIFSVTSALLAAAAGDKILNDDIFSREKADLLSNKIMDVLLSDNEKIKNTENTEEKVSSVQIQDNISKDEFKNKPESEIEDASPTENSTKTDVSEEKPVEINDKTCKADFPKKRGRLTANQEKLKSVVTSQTFYEKDVEKLIAVCEKFLEKETYTPSENAVSLKEAALMFADELASAENTTAVINKYYGIFVSHQIKAALKPASADNQAAFYFPETETQAGEEIKAVNNSGESSVPVAGTKEDSVKEPEWKYYYVATGTVDKSAFDAIRKLLKCAERTFFDDRKDVDRILWAGRRYNAKNITEEDVIRELNSIEQSKAVKKNTRSYKNITRKNAVIVANLINSDSRMEHYTIHAAMRMIDRYIDFYNREESIYEQLNSMLNSFSNVVKRAFKQGVNIKSHYEIDKKDAKRYKFMIEIPSSAYNQKDQAFFGSRPLTIAVCEFWGAEKECSKHNMPPIILSVFSD